MDLGKRLLQLRKSNDVTQEELGRQIGVGKTTISNYETGYSTPDTETVSRIADFFDVSTDYLLGRTDVPLKNIEIINKFIKGEDLSDEEIRIITPDAEAAEIQKLIKKFNPKLLKEPAATHKASRGSKDKKRLPILGSIRAGLPILADEHVEDILEVPDYIEADYVLRVQGDSMVGAGILDGDLAICREAQVAQSGQIVVALNDLATGFSGATLKYFLNGSGDNPVLRAANPQYQDIDIKKGYRIAGVMVALIREDSPSYQTYKEFLTIKDKDEWTVVIEKATGYGITPEQLLNNLDMQWRMIERMRKGKSK